ncbi:unnamed protein product [Onchocerca flexuosa]|uniref:Transmembrane protein n=1 Tax=Onchocerca flexuosa TaxID=387005 RepID=A0A183H1J2_9BILA|nr:unnamed protein product [Onchocerca flexuosa]
MEEKMEERKLQLLTNITASIFLLTVITSAVLALSIWDHSHYQALWNVAYYGQLFQKIFSMKFVNCGNIIKQFTNEKKRELEELKWSLVNGSLIASISISTIIVIMLLRGIRHKQPYLLLPFIIYCSLQSAVSLLVLSYFVTTALLQFWFSGAFSLYAIQLIAIFTSASLYWITSLRIVQKQRKRIQKSAEQHYLLV